VSRQSSVVSKIVSRQSSVVSKNRESSIVRREWNFSLAHDLQHYVCINESPQLHKGREWNLSLVRDLHHYVCINESPQPHRGHEWNFSLVRDLQYYVCTNESPQPHRGSRLVTYKEQKSPLAPAGQNIMGKKQTFNCASSLVSENRKS